MKLNCPTLAKFFKMRILISDEIDVVKQIFSCTIFRV